MVSNVSIADEKTFTERYKATGNAFDILIIEPKKQFSTSLGRDLRFLQMSYSSLKNVVSLEEAYIHIEETMPHLVILSLNLPTTEIQEFLEMYPPQSRPFALVFTEVPFEPIVKIRTSLQQISRSTNLVAEHRAVGYYLIGVTSNSDFISMIERARHCVQEQFWNEQKDNMTIAINEYLQHPIIIGQPTTFHISPDKDATPLHSALNGELYYSVDKNEYALPFDRIVWIQGDKKYCRVHYITNDGELLSEYLPKKNIVEQLPPIIINTHSSYWVNIAYIRQLRAEEVELITNQTIPISRRERKSLDDILHSVPPSMLLFPLLQKILRRTSLHRRKLLFSKRKYRFGRREFGRREFGRREFGRRAAL
jgi:hypothetical protein